MIRIRVAIREGVPVSIASSGHAARHRDESAACAAVSLALKSFGEALIAHPELQVAGGAARPGEFRVEVVPSAAPLLAGWYAGASEVVLAALRAAAEGWPEEIRLIVDEQGVGENGA